MFHKETQFGRTVWKNILSLNSSVLSPGPLWIVLVADADGFVPLSFKPKEELTVRNGKRKTNLRTPGSPDTSCPSSPAPDQKTSTTTEGSM